MNYTTFTYQDIEVKCNNALQAFCLINAERFRLEAGIVSEMDIYWVEGNKFIGVKMEDYEV